MINTIVIEDLRKTNKYIEDVAKRFVDQIMKTKSITDENIALKEFITDMSFAYEVYLDLGLLRNPVSRQTVRLTKIKDYTIWQLSNMVKNTPNYLEIRDIRLDKNCKESDLIIFTAFCLYLGLIGKNVFKDYICERQDGRVVAINDLIKMIPVPWYYYKKSLRFVEKMIERY